MTPREIVEALLAVELPNELLEPVPETFKQRKEFWNALEWAVHGTIAGDSTADYLAATEVLWAIRLLHLARAGALRSEAGAAIVEGHIKWLSDYPAKLRPETTSGLDREGQ